MSREIRELGVPIVVTDAAGKPAAAANTPFDSVVADPRRRDALAADRTFAAYVDGLDRQNAPVRQPEIATVHFGDTPFVRRMRVIPVVQLGVLAVLLLSGVAIVRTRGRADRERVWAGMARESAHQLGTPLSSLHGWVELLGEGENDPIVAQALPHMQGDIERLERVSHRFERIGRPPRSDPVDISAIATRVADYFSARLPTLANPITLRVERADGPLHITGDRVLLEWALESLVKNAIDALAGSGGSIVVRVDPLRGNRVRVRVADDGPGIPRELRGKIFSAGFTTKERGWGIGLALTRRIVEEQHGGKLQLAPSDRGAVFDIILTG
jgi:signal transduction histidine kinase